MLIFNNENRRICGLIACFIGTLLLAFFSDKIIKGEVSMKKFFGFLTVIIIMIVVCMSVVFCADSTAVVKTHFDIKSIDWVNIIKWVGVVLGALAGGSVTVWSVIMVIWGSVPNDILEKWADKWAIFLTALCRQKAVEARVDSFESSYIRFSRRVDKKMQELNPDIPNIK